MTIATEGRRFATRDGGAIGAHVAIPESGTGPGVLVIQESLGVNDYVRDVARQLANLGYVVAAPDVYWRLERNVECEHDEAGLERAMSFLARLDGELALHDLADALAALRSQPEVTGPTGVVGFCLGGRLAFRVATDAEPDCVVSYYGVGIDEDLGGIDAIECPTLVVYGTDDAFVPVETVHRIRDALASHPKVDVELYEGMGHAFLNPHAPWFEGAVAAEAWKRGTDFLAAHLRGST